MKLIGYFCIVAAIIIGIRGAYKIHEYNEIIQNPLNDLLDTLPTSGRTGNETTKTVSNSFGSDPVLSAMERKANQEAEDFRQFQKGMSIGKSTFLEAVRRVRNKTAKKYFGVAAFLSIAGVILITRK